MWASLKPQTQGSIPFCVHAKDSQFETRRRRESLGVFRKGNRVRIVQIRIYTLISCDDLLQVREKPTEGNEPVNMPLFLSPKVIWLITQGCFFKYNLSPKSHAH